MYTTEEKEVVQDSEKQTDKNTIEQEDIHFKIQQEKLQNSMDYYVKTFIMTFQNDYYTLAQA